MNPYEPTFGRLADLPTAASVRRDFAALASDLLPLGDALCLAAAGTLAGALFGFGALDGGVPPAHASGLGRATAYAAVLAPFILYDPRFGRQALRRAAAGLMAAHLARFAGLLAVLFALAALGDASAFAPIGWWGGMALMGIASTSMTRLWMARRVRRWHREGVLTGADAPSAGAGYVGDSLRVTLLCDRPIKRWDAVVKTTEDLVLGTLFTLALLPVLVVIAVAIKLDSPGPVLFRQRRHAMNNREFDIYKFRTMRWASAQAGTPLDQTTRNDQRITRIGRLLRATSLDELPQLFNVLQGDMSLVGPRPHATNMRTEDRLGGEITEGYAHRHRVKPGITGWAQVNGARGATETTGQLRRRVELDLHYIDHWSLQLDLEILARTVGVVLKRTNAF